VVSGRRSRERHQRGLNRSARIGIITVVRAFRDQSRRIEPPGELAIGIVAQLGGDDRSLSGKEQELAIGAECAASSGVGAPVCAPVRSGLAPPLGAAIGHSWRADRAVARGTPSPVHPSIPRT
jgi:hypothetical protein